MDATLAKIKILKRFKKIKSVSCECGRFSLNVFMLRTSIASGIFVSSCDFTNLKKREEYK